MEAHAEDEGRENADALVRGGSREVEDVQEEMKRVRIGLGGARKTRNGTTDQESGGRGSTSSCIKKW